MKLTRRIIERISLVLCLVLVLTGVMYVIEINANGQKWLNRASNARIAKARQTTIQGTVYDRNLKPLSWSVNPGTREYINDLETRLALAHTVGEQTNQNSSGVEYRHATTLLGMDATRTDLTMQSLSGDVPEGDNLTLTVDAELTKYIYSLFPENAMGACVIINYKTGAILGKVSLPTFDPAHMEFKAEDTAYRDRVLQEQYAPGSTFKIVVLEAALENLAGIANEHFNCLGVWNLGKYSISCAGGNVHGELTLHDAFAKSCNVSFSSIAYQVGAEALKKVAERFGFNTLFNFADIVMNPSHCLDHSMSDGEVIQAGIGQGKTQVTPLHMAMISGAIANGGVMMEPKLIKQVTNHAGETVSTMHESVYTTVATPAQCELLSRYLLYATENGTGTSAKVSGLTVCGKTGSAEWTSNKNVATNAWYTGFVSADPAHPYAIAVVVEQGGYGSSTAAPIAAKVLQKAYELNVY